jgi:Flp pilus assembly pilin Flp
VSSFLQKFVGELLSDTTGQDLAEYTLLLALVSLLAIGVAVGLGANAKQIWQMGNTTLNTAAEASAGTVH